MQSSVTDSHYVKPVYVYEVPVRIWHWLMAICIFVLITTGLLLSYLPLAALPANLPNEELSNYYHHYVRLVHFATGYIFAVAFLGRLYWAIVGNTYARQIFYLPLFSAHWWQEVMFEIRWYLFLESTPKKCLGHNPLAQIAMFFFITLGSIFMIFTGFALYSEGAGIGSWQDQLFGWVIPFLGQSQDVHTWHTIGMWLMICFIIIHLYLVVREDIMSRQTIISTIVNGYRLFKDDKK